MLSYTKFVIVNILYELLLMISLQILEKIKDLNCTLNLITVLIELDILLC